MNTYLVNFHNDRQWASRDFDAETPEQALDLALRFAMENLLELDLYDYDACNTPINEIEVSDGGGDPLVTWYDEDMSLRLAARDLLSAAEKVLDRWQNGDIGEAIHELAFAVEAAKDGVA